LVQHRIKRLLAYSTISHVGFLLLALVINSTESVQAFLFYLMQYSLSNINVFFILIIIGYYLLEISRNADRRLLEINNSPALGCGKPLLLWDLLPNSGNPLKLMVPNYIRKTISG
jgi:NADH:ubiquinone oxidoreductase subunit 2 (subunit N)